MVESLDNSELPIIDEIMTTGPMAVTEAKRLALNFDRWTGTDEELRRWTLDKTSQMRGSEEGQEGLASFLGEAFTQLESGVNQMLEPDWMVNAPLTNHQGSGRQSWRNRLSYFPLLC